MDATNVKGTHIFCQILQKGFTLVELMIAMVIASLISAALYTAYTSQQRSQITQGALVEMQQHLRGGMNFLIRELRMAGFDPQTNAGAGIVAATKTSLTFTQDLNDNGVGKTPGNSNVTDPGESITYGLTAGADANNDGIVDANFISATGADVGTASIERTTNDPITPGPFPIADHIEALELLYLVGDDYSPTLTPAAAQFDDIKAIVVSILARVRNPDPNYTNNQIYLPASNDPNYQNGEYNMSSGVTWPANDNYRRRLMISTVNLRNMGI